MTSLCSSNDAICPKESVDHLAGKRENVGYQHFLTLKQCLPVLRDLMSNYIIQQCEG